jgi:hypothetical protein
MSTVLPSVNPENGHRLKLKVFDDIRDTRKTDFINNIWRYLVYDAHLSERTWEEVKAVMATPSELDPLT